MSLLGTYVLFDIFQHDGVYVKKETTVNFLIVPQEGGLTFSPTNILVYEWIGGKHACIDLTDIFPLVGLRTEDFTVEQGSLSHFK